MSGLAVEPEAPVPTANISIPRKAPTPKFLENKIAAKMPPSRVYTLDLSKTTSSRPSIC